MEIKTTIKGKEVKITLTKEQLEEINKQTSKKKMRPEVGDTWFYINEFGKRVINSIWYNYSSQNRIWNQGNGFFTEEEAEFKSQKRIYMKQYKDWCEEKSDELDWGNEDTEKYYVAYNFSDNRIEAGYNYCHKIQGVIYASSEKITEDFIREIGKDKFKKYILGV